MSVFVRVMSRKEFNDPAHPPRVRTFTPAQNASTSQRSLMDSMRIIKFKNLVAPFEQAGGAVIA